MEMVMHARLTIIAAAALVLGTSAFAEPVKTRGAQPAQPATPPAAVVLASADQIRDVPASADQPAAPVKRPRAARVTTCRCGDQQASAEQN
jgi:hypothetical protein